MKTYSKRRRQLAPSAASASPSLKQLQQLEKQQEQEHGAAHSLMELCTSANSSPVKSTQQRQGKTPVKMTRKDGKVCAYVHWFQTTIQ